MYIISPEIPIWLPKIAFSTGVGLISSVARNELGFREGKNDGFIDGFEEGSIDGNNDGIVLGLVDDANDGDIEGFKEGCNEGFILGTVDGN